MTASLHSVASIGHAILAGWAAYVLRVGATTKPRMRLSWFLGSAAAYSLLIGAGYSSPAPAAEGFFDACVVAAQIGIVLLALFAWELAPGVRVGRGLRSLGVASIVASASLAFMAFRAKVVGPPTGLFAAIQHLILLFGLAAVIIGLVRAARQPASGRETRARLAKGIIFGVTWLFVPAILNGLVNLFETGLLLYGLVRNLSILACVFSVLLAYLDFGDEPTSLGSRLVLASLATVIGVCASAAALLQPLLGPLQSRVALTLMVIELAATALVLIIFPLFYKRTITLPLDRLVDGARRVAAGESGVEVEVIHHDELGILARTFNVMTTSLEEKQARLDAHVVQVDGLNAELRRQVAARSRELGGVLAGMPVATARLQLGERVDGRYVVLAELGEGGMGVVYEVERMVDGQHFAMKLMTGATSREQATRFAREAEIAARLNHANLVSVVDVGMSQSAVFLVMDLVRGASLESYRGRFGDVAWARRMLQQVAAGMVALHDLGIVHRDIKPANILIEARGEETVVRIGDFGIARHDIDPAFAETAGIDGFGETRAGTDVRALTRTGAMMGTPLYMAPELAHGGRAGSAADVFAFGVVAHEMLTGEYPFAVPPVFEALSGREPQAKVAESLAPSLRALVQHCLSASPGDRPSAKALMEALG